MSEPATETGRELAATPAPRPVREYRVVENALGIMDTARFEHIGRVATVLAKAGLLPESLTHTGPKDKREPLPYDVIQARAYLIVNQADLFQMDPNALAQCSSFVHGKLMYEGKLVHALVAAKLGVDLVYEFGLYDPVARDIIGQYEEDQDGPMWVGQMPTKVDDQTLAVRVSGTLPGERRRRWIAGSVGMWHKGPSSPWGSAQAWPRQLRYMGAREWVRAHKPNLILGIITDDEVDEYDMARQVGAVAPAAPQLVHAGFSDVRPAQIEQGPGRKPRQTRAKADPANEPAKSDAASAEVNAALGGDDLPATVKSPTAEEIATANAALGATESEGQKTSTPAEIAEIEASEGHAAPGQVYLLAGEPADAKGRWPTFKDGKPFSSVPDATAHPCYWDHAPEVTETEEQTAAVENWPQDEEVLPPEFSAFINSVEAARDFPAVKSALKTLQGGAYWKTVTDEQANRIRRNTWETMADNFDAEALPNPAKDVSAFRLWVEAQDEPESIMDGLTALEGDPEFMAKPEPMKEQIRGAANARIAVLEP